MPMYRAEVIQQQTTLRKPKLHDKSLVLYLPFDKDDGSYARDRSGYNRHGVVYGATHVAGKVGSALSFDGVDDYVSTPLIEDYYQLTVLAWVYVPTLTDIRCVVSKNENAWRLTTSTDGVYFQWRGVNSDKTGWLAQYAIPAYGRWYFLGGRLRLNYADLIVDGAIVATTAWKNSFYLTGRPVWVGRNEVGTASPFSYMHYWPGVIDEVRVFNRALSLAEIQRLMNMRGM